MATNMETFLKNIADIADAKPIYTKNGDTKDECDCIGLIIGAQKNAGVSWNGIHGSNYAAREAIDGFFKINRASELSVGMIVFKSYVPNDKDYGLDVYPRYLKGGKYYNGDLNDYYHVGVVTNTSPLEITHMTTPTSAVDTKLGKWSHAGWLKKRYISDRPAFEETTQITETAVVVAESGSTVKMRMRPSTDSSLYWDVPVGAIVNITEHDDKWCKISYGGNTGYMMTKFLSSGAIPSKSYECHIVFATKAEADALAAKYKNAWVTEAIG